MKKGFFFISMFLLFSCAEKHYPFATNYIFKSTNQLPDYSNLDYWAAHPWKHNPSDSVPKPLQKNYQHDSAVDVFFLYPTSYTNPKKPFGWNAPIDNAEINAKTDYSSILYQASIFNGVARIFSPRYRQANLSAYFPINKEDSIQSAAAFELAYQDIKTAFEYYLANDNHGRPIIIASHSQGTTHAKRLLKEFFDGKLLQQQLVAAYIIGMSVEPYLLENIKACQQPNQTGCICSWRTFKEGYKPDFVEKENFISIVTNPLTWDSLQPKASRKLNEGSILYHFNKLSTHVADANNEAGILWTGRPSFFGNIFYGSKNYHIADLNFYYLSIRKNVQQRIDSYLKNKPRS